MRALFDGRFDEAEESIQQALAIGRRAEGPDAFTCYVFQMYLLRREQGRLEDIADTVIRSVDEYPSNRLLRCMRADLLRDRGRRNEVRRMLQDILVDGFTTVPSHNEWGPGMSYLSEVAAFVDDTSMADTLYTKLLPYAGQALTEAGEVNMGSASRSLGILATTMHKWEEAARHFEDALEMNERMGSRPWVAHTRHDHARMLLFRDAPGDRKRAQELLEQALDTARELGIAALTARVLTLLDEQGLTAAAGVAQKVGTSGTPAVQTFLFTDIVRSTELVEAVGDEVWEDVLRWHDRTLRSFFERHRGQEVDHAGDGFFIAFDDADSALRSAVEIQRALAEHRRLHGFAPTVRIGVHGGEARKVEGGYRGRAVHQGARIAALAGGGEILASRETARQAPDIPSSDPREVLLKGLASPVEIVTIPWLEPVQKSRTPS
jgi:class 3 adenylate cyclase